MKQGRHKYFSISNTDVAAVLEALMGLAARTGHTRTRTGPKDAALRKARVCYNHLAGDMGTRLYDRMTDRGLIVENEEALVLTDIGVTFATNFGIDVAKLSKAKAPLCKTCLDWSERRSHLAGSLGRALFARFEDLGWATREKTTRVVTFSPSGEVAFETFLDRHLWID